MKTLELTNGQYDTVVSAVRILAATRCGYVKLQNIHPDEYKPPSTTDNPDILEYDADMDSLVEMFGLSKALLVRREE